MSNIHVRIKYSEPNSMRYLVIVVSVKTCPSLAIPFYGMVVCKNVDLNLNLDYTPRNETFMEFYDRDELRITEPMPSDTDCTFKCGPGFYMVGSTKRNCLPLSKWDGLQTACKRMIVPECTRKVWIRRMY